MATGQFEVDTDSLRHSTAELWQFFQVLKNSQVELQENIAEISSMWEGPAKEAFHQQSQADFVEFEEVCKQISETLSCMDEAAKEYDTCDEQVRSIVDGIKV